MHSLETQGLLKADSPRFGWLDVAKILYEKNTLLIDRLRFDARQLARKRRGERVSSRRRYAREAPPKPRSGQRSVTALYYHDKFGFVNQVCRPVWGYFAKGHGPPPRRGAGGLMDRPTSLVRPQPDIVKRKSATSASRRSAAQAAGACRSRSRRAPRARVTATTEVNGLLVTLATIAATIYAYRVIPKGFFSSEDTGVIVSRTQGLQGISFPDMVERQTLATQIISADPAVMVVNSIVAPLCATLCAPL
jgi:hypothetical protein